MYPDVQLYIDGAWTDAAAGRKLVVINPATGEPAGTSPMPSAPTSTALWRPPKRASTSGARSPPTIARR